MKILRMSELFSNLEVPIELEDILSTDAIIAIESLKKISPTIENYELKYLESALHELASVRDESAKRKVIEDLKPTLLKMEQIVELAKKGNLFA